MTTDNTKRFSNRVEDYVRYRPGYPAAIITYLQQQFGMNKAQQVADIGAGTGISSALFLSAGYKVTAVEPNNKMREKAIELLNTFPQFNAVDGTAEHTTLVNNTIDIIIAGQAFHWFDMAAAKAEFKRILKDDGYVVLIWNERLIASAFEKEYDQLIIKHGKDYVEVGHRNIDDKNIGAFFSPQPFHYKTFANRQLFDMEGLQGRLLSSSYMPVKGDAGYDAMIEDLRKLFERYKEEGFITINYLTKVYAGKI
jgi:ubiquinone/menaquinone biosynthesis C-methylase UbiE